MAPEESGVGGKVSSVVEKGSAVLHQGLPGKYFMGLSAIGAERPPQYVQMLRGERGVSKGLLSSPRALEFLTASVKARQAQELYWCWLGSSWLWEHSNNAFPPWSTAEEQIVWAPLTPPLWP